MKGVCSRSRWPQIRQLLPRHERAFQSLKPRPYVLIEDFRHAILEFFSREQTNGSFRNVKSEVLFHTLKVEAKVCIPDGESHYRCAHARQKYLHCGLSREQIIVGDEVIEFKVCHGVLFHLLETPNKRIVVKLLIAQAWPLTTLTCIIEFSRTTAITTHEVDAIFADPNICISRDS